MKRFISIGLLLLYSVASSGMTVRFHYCGDWLASVKVFMADDGRITGCCEQELLGDTDDNCCNTESVVLDVDDEGAAGVISAGLPTEALLPQTNFIPKPAEFTLPLAQVMGATDGSPPWPQPLFLLYSAFLI